MDVILTISFNITAEIKITKHIKGINKQQEKYHVSREKIVHSENIKYMDKQSEFLPFPTIYCEKLELITI